MSLMIDGEIVGKDTFSRKKSQLLSDQLEITRTEFVCSCKSYYLNAIRVSVMNLMEIAELQRRKHVCVFSYG